LQSCGEDYDIIFYGEDYVITAKCDSEVEFIEADADFSDLDINAIKNFDGYTKYVTTDDEIDCLKKGALYDKLLLRHNNLERRMKELEKDTTPEINTLISGYYKALNDRNKDGIGKICKGDVDTMMSKADILSKYIDSHYLLHIYTVKGATPGSYVVYAISNDKLGKGSKDMFYLQNVETFYVATDENGELYIDCDSADKKINDYIKSLDKDQIVGHIIEKGNNWKYFKEYKDVCDDIIKMKEELADITQI